LSSSNPFEISLATTALSQIVTPDLGRDLFRDLMNMLSHSRPYIRKKVVLLLYKVFLKYPEALKIVFPKLKSRLDDPNPGKTSVTFPDPVIKKIKLKPNVLSIYFFGKKKTSYRINKNKSIKTFVGVVSAVVNVICELARKKPQNYLTLAPQLYGLLTNSANNWMLIKIIKLFANLLTLEPRLQKKLVGPITSIIKTTKAMSLLYECLHTAIVGGLLPFEKITTANNETVNEHQEDHETREPVEDPLREQLAILCISKLRLFVEDPDQNLKYLGLHILKLLLPIRPSTILSYRDVVLTCLDDPDLSIRRRALDLISGMVNSKNLVDIVKRLMNHLIKRSPPSSLIEKSKIPTNHAMDESYAKEIVDRIIDVCSRDMFHHVTNFAWYLHILIDIAKGGNWGCGVELSEQILDVVVRVKEVREEATSMMYSLMTNEKFTETAKQENNNIDVLYAAAWIMGEYFQYLVSPLKALKSLLLPAIEYFPVNTQAVCIQSALKIFAHWGSTLELDEYIVACKNVKDTASRLTISEDLELAERAAMIDQLIPKSEYLNRDDMMNFHESLKTLFNIEFNAIASKAQRKVLIPDGLDLDSWIHSPLKQEEINNSTSPMSLSEEHNEYRDNLEFKVRSTFLTISVFFLSFYSN